MLYDTLVTSQVTFQEPPFCVLEHSPRKQREGDLERTPSQQTLIGGERLEFSLTDHSSRYHEVPIGSFRVSVKCFEFDDTRMNGILKSLLVTI